MLFSNYRIGRGQIIIMRSLLEIKWKTATTTATIMLIAYADWMHWIWLMISNRAAREPYSLTLSSNDTVRDNWRVDPFYQTRSQFRYPVLDPFTYATALFPPPPPPTRPACGSHPTRELIDRMIRQWKRVCCTFSGVGIKHGRNNWNS